MVTFNHRYNGSRESMMVDYVFYGAAVLLAVAVFSYLIFSFKVQLQSRIVDDLEADILGLGKGENQALNKKVLSYKNKIDDFTVILENHSITSNVLLFIEEHTADGVRFSNFDMKKDSSTINLSGQAPTMELLAGQVKLFEESKDYIKDVSVLDSSMNASGGVTFNMSLSFDPQILEAVKKITNGN